MIKYVFDLCIFSIVYHVYIIYVICILGPIELYNWLSINNVKKLYIGNINTFKDTMSNIFWFFIYLIKSVFSLITHIFKNLMWFFMFLIKVIKFFFKKIMYLISITFKEIKLLIDVFYVIYLMHPFIFNKINKVFKKIKNFFKKKNLYLYISNINYELLLLDSITIMFCFLITIILNLFFIQLMFPDHAFLLDITYHLFFYLTYLAMLIVATDIILFNLFNITYFSTISFIIILLIILLYFSIAFIIKFIFFNMLKLYTYTIVCLYFGSVFIIKFIFLNTLRLYTYTIVLLYFSIAIIVKFIFFNMLKVVTDTISLYKKILKICNFFVKKNYKNFFFKKISIYYDIIIFFLKKYIYTINHKRIALNYLYFCFFSAMTGLFLATIIRIELAIPGSHFFKGDSTKYLQVITSHGLIMVFFVVTPVLFGFFGNFFIPFHIGSKDVAFPRLNSFGFWILFCGFIVLSKPASLRRQLFKYYDNSDFYYNFLQYKTDRLYQVFDFFKTKDFCYTNYRFFNNNFDETILWFFFNENIFNKTKSTFTVQVPNASLTMSGWTFITPFSSKTKFTGFGSQDIAIIAVILAGISTTISFVNLLITRRTLSMPGLRNRKILMPFLSINLFLTMRMLALIIPVLGAAMIMLELDRHFGYSFFDYSYGGDPILFHHLFWFFGHPEVYVVIIPSFGVISMVLPFFNFRRIAAKNHLIWATYIMAYMGFLVWGHHMYLVGLDHRSRSMYSTVTVMISLPAIVKIVNWTLTLLNGSFLLETPIIFSFIFLLFFLCGGLTGMWLSHVGLNIYVHDTFYIVAHFHFMFSAATFSAIFTCIYYYFWQIFSIKYSEYFSYLHAFYWFCGQWLTFLPIFWIGYNGCPRRYHDYPIIFFGWNSMASYGHILTIISVILFFLMILDSYIIKANNTQFNLNIPRWHKRINYYFFKISYIQNFKKNNTIRIYKYIY